MSKFLETHEKCTRYKFKINIVRWEEHEDLTKDSEVARHVKYNRGHKIEWTILVKGLKNTKIRKIFEAFYIAKFRPSLNGQVQHQNLTLFRNGIT